MDEKIPTGAGEYSTPPSEIETSRDWSVEEERKAKWKLDLLIMPILTLGFFCLQLDRGNIANALTDNFFEDVGITQDQFNVGQQMLSLGIVLFEIPSNMVLYRVGPGKWLTLQLFLFGTVSTFQAFMSNYGSFIATRFLLGITESGFIPGGLWTLSTWYTRKETAKRVMFFYFGNQFGQASAKLLAYGILHMRGVGGKPGWFWLFALMGGFTCLSGLIFGFFLPDSFKNPHSTFLPKVQIFTEREIYILRTRVLRDEPAKGKKKSRIGLTAFKKTFSNWRMWVHFLITLANNGPQRGFDTYAPSIVRAMGFKGLSANALAAVGLFIQIPVSFSFSWFSDRYNRRGETVIAGLSMVILGYAFNRGFTELTGPSTQGAKYFGVVWTQIFGTFSHPLNITWMSLTCTDSEERALAMAMVIMGANIAGIYGAQLYREDDSPRYRRAFLVAMAVLIFGCALSIVRKIDEIRLRRKHRDDSLVKEASQSEIDAYDNLQVQPLPVAAGPPPAAVAADVPTVVR
ncbi:putative major facilitator superfamily transporter [Zymoseptoria tritici IPO323]|uniref:Major facilitator superfamily transporter n=1 Tax=Zymoseptoria tritici (strain CBS 115943 / IPO323) TaxID=336722 RepID=F9X5B1_ZYMTI|nr:putative major facilitator superfamily transporter [Zymoseptoria tritici IPO323]EGP88996.1 putative major facilitator superfamily transporter [Zymoseptoria tritici IPO323]